MIKAVAFVAPGTGIVSWAGALAALHAAKERNRLVESAIVKRTVLNELGHDLFTKRGV
jgi:hypothetical protein